MQLYMVGINHHTAPLAVREKAAVSSTRLADSLSTLHSYISQGVILSTCNRTEIYTTFDRTTDVSVKKLQDFLTTELEISETELKKHVYTHAGTAAVTHLFKVASGLESLIVGEHEVLGQVGQSLTAAEKAGMVDLPLRHAFQSAIRTGRLVREETGISRNVMSVSSVAVDLAADITGNLKTCEMLVIGAGEAGRLVAEVASKRGVSRIVIANRTRARAQDLASLLNGVAKDLGDLDEELGSANIVVTCAGAPHRILGFERIETAMKKRPGIPLVIIDIAVPRNVEPEVSGIGNVFLYNIDHLAEIAARNRKQRESEIQHADEIINNEVNKFSGWWHDLELRPLIGALMSRAEQVRSAQLKKTLKRLPQLSDEQRENLESMTRSIVSRILEDPVHYLKTNGNNSQIELVKELFNLEEGNLSEN